MVDALHKAAIAGDDPGAVIDEVIAELGVEVALGDGHAHRHREALPQRPGGAFGAGQMGVFRVAGARAAKLAEIADLVHCRVLVTRQVEQRVEQHRTVAGGEHEAVAVGPFGRGGVETQELVVEHRRDIGHAHRHPGVAAVGRLDRVHGEGADGIGHARKPGGGLRGGGGIGVGGHFGHLHGALRGAAGPCGWARP